MITMRAQHFVSVLTIFALLAGLQFVQAWTGPTQTAPDGNVAAPINVGTTDQIKNAGLGINSLAVFGNSIFSAASYLNWGTVSGSGGYGIRDNAGVIELKNTGGGWTPVLAANGGFKLPTNDTVTTCDGTTEGTARYNSSLKQMQYCNGTSWQAVSSTNTSFTISSDTQNVNLYTLAGSPASAGEYTITINSGVVVGSANAGTPALVSGTWPAGSTVTLINKGTIVGKGGAGGNGPSNGAGGAGGAGGAAVSLSYNLTIDNTNGYIYGGGGGGGGGGGLFVGTVPSVTLYGGGGGGGAGVTNTAGGSPNGGTGTIAGPGAGGARQTYSTWYSGAGGSGGAFGTAGVAGNPSTAYAGGAGGAAGAAVLLNSRVVTWLGGNNATQVKGAVQ